jgi:hypothetical protein
MKDLEVIKTKWSQILKNFIPLDPEGEDYFNHSEVISLDEIVEKSTFRTGAMREYTLTRLTIKIKYPEFVGPAQNKESILKTYIEEVTGIRVNRIKIRYDLLKKDLEDFKVIENHAELKSDIFVHFEKIDANWDEILVQLKQFDFKSWIVFANSMPLSLNKNLLAVGFRFYNNVLEASEIDHLENLKKAIHLVTSLNVSIDILVIIDDAFVTKFKEKNKNKEQVQIPTESKDKPKSEIITNLDYQNLQVQKKHLVSNSNRPIKRWHKILVIIILIYILILILDSRFEFIPDFNSGTSVDKNNCKTYYDSAGNYRDPCGEGFVPEENPGYQGR